MGGIKEDQGRERDDHGSENREGEGDAYLTGQGVDRECKWRRGSSIGTEVKRSRNPAKFSSLTAMLSFNITYLGKRPPVNGSGKGSRGGG